MNTGFLFRQRLVLHILNLFTNRIGLNQSISESASPEVRPRPRLRVITPLLRFLSARKLISAL